MAFWEKEWISKGDLQSFVKVLDDNAALCPHCITVMKLYSGNDGNYYACPTIWCPNEARIPQEEIEGR